MEYSTTKNMVISELEAALSAVDETAVEEFIAILEQAKRVFVTGAGRSELSLLAFVKRLTHMGIRATYAGAVNAPPITAKDLLIIGSCSGETAVPVAVARTAKQHKAKIAYIGSNMNSVAAEIADLTVNIPHCAKTGQGKNAESQQPMNSLFEQSLMLLLDIVAFMMIRRNGIDEAELRRNHANLE